MSDLRLRRLLRRYSSEPTIEHASAFIREYTRQSGQQREEWVDDMAVANVDLSDLVEEPDQEGPEIDRVHEWIGQNACFTHTDPHVYEFIVYIGIIDEGDPFTVHTFRNIGGTWDPTPKELIPAIREAHGQGFKYICFYM